MPTATALTAAPLRSVPRMTPRASVLVVLANELVRHGLLGMLKGFPGADRVWACGAAQEALAVLPVQRPDVVLCHGADPAAAELAEAVRAHGGRTLLVLDDLELESLDERVLLRVDGFVVQSQITAASLRGALDRLAAGEMPLPADLARSLLAAKLSGGRSRPSRGISLTPRERQVIALLAEGLSNKQIARRLTLTEHGVKRHVTNLLAKLNSPNRTLAVATALREGLVEPA